MSEQINDKELKSKEAGEMYLPGKAILRGIPTPPRKRRLVVDNIRGMEVERALATPITLRDLQVVDVLKNFFVVQLPTGNRSMNVKPSKSNFM